MTLIEQIIQRCRGGNDKIEIELIGRLMEARVRCPNSCEDDFVIVEITKDQFDEAQKNLDGFRVIHISKVTFPIKP